jgi:hypothetical protein
MMFYEIISPFFQHLHNNTLPITQGNKKIFFLGALVFRPVPGVIWGADSEKCTG